ncbi:MAG: hypothetical protein UW78_C0025G0002 [Candidatus Azambacteria bacterium GW2011_GWA1_44_9]|uniref:Uncharacterized protein n=1 Tax=Candidatus Azambacteria bacterium GW2011_GWA1_44_9 TaxID=1618610 RepID=A0A0G1MIX2_9BACT|nr:MAG: hypothetical protein UW78_C0025G0002 [Candidatus Azambacteria bacterium GW2011_GWA1_44_9]
MSRLFLNSNILDSGESVFALCSEYGESFCMDCVGDLDLLVMGVEAEGGKKVVSVARGREWDVRGPYDQIFEVNVDWSGVTVKVERDGAERHIKIPAPSAGN